MLVALARASKGRPRLLAVQSFWERRKPTPFNKGAKGPLRLNPHDPFQEARLNGHSDACACCHAVTLSWNRRSNDYAVFP